ncbi:MAG: insulinase family protein [Alistipes sp.]|nr:insulinase family protein [Alistipes sp.]MDE5906724.1 insulinase family protein [Alistipes sp.]
MKRRPPLAIPSSVDVQSADKELLSNGVALYTLPANDFEVLRVTFVFHAGSAVQEKPFTASATANLLSEGTRNASAREIAERLDYYGSWFDVNLDRDYAYISFATLSKFYRQTLDVAEEILLHPVFPKEELRTYCAKRKQRLRIDRQKVDVEAREAFARALFGDRHPYGIAYDEALYDTLTRADIESFYRTHYTAENCFVVCSGRITDEERKAIAAIAAQLPHGETTRPTFPHPETRHETRIAHPGAVQSSIRIGRLLFDRRHPDFVGMQVVATLLGGYFGSRLMQNLRERHGYTYGVVAAMVNFENTGYLAIATQVGSEATEAALGEILAEIERLRTESPTEEELSLVKNIMTSEMMRILDGPFGIADVTIENILCGADNAIIDENLRIIRAMTPADVRRLAQRYLKREDLVTVVVGEETKEKSDR